MDSTTNEPVSTTPDPMTAILAAVATLKASVDEQYKSVTERLDKLESQTMNGSLGTPKSVKLTQPAVETSKRQPAVETIKREVKETKDINTSVDRYECERPNVNFGSYAHVSAKSIDSHLQPNIRLAIIEGRYVDFRDLIPSQSTGTIQHRAINWNEWVQAWSIYQLVLTDHHFALGHNILGELAKHFNQILSLFRAKQDWRMYDRDFRYAMEVNKSVQWGHILSNSLANAKKSKAVYESVTPTPLKYDVEKEKLTSCTDGNSQETLDKHSMQNESDKKGKKRKMEPNLRNPITSTSNPSQPSSFSKPRERMSNDSANINKPLGATRYRENVSDFSRPGKEIFKPHMSGFPLSSSSISRRSRYSTSPPSDFTPRSLPVRNYPSGACPSWNHTEVCKVTNCVRDHFCFNCLGPHPFINCTKPVRFPDWPYNTFFSVKKESLFKPK